MLWQKLKECHRKLHNRNDKDRRKMLRQKIKGWHRKLQNIKDKGRCNRLRQNSKEAALIMTAEEILKRGKKNTAFSGL